MAEAADEIERLKERVASLQASSGYEASIAQAEIELQRTTIADTMSDLGKAEVEVERLKADNKRLRLELRDVIIQRDALMREPKP